MKKKFAKAIEAYRTSMRKIHPWVRIAAIVLIVVLGGVIAGWCNAYMVKPLTVRSSLTLDSAAVRNPDGTENEADLNFLYEMQINAARNAYAVQVAEKALMTCPDALCVLMDADEVQTAAWMADPEMAACAYIERNQDAGNADRQKDFIKKLNDECVAQQKKIGELNASIVMVNANDAENPLTAATLLEMARAYGVQLDPAFVPVVEESVEEDATAEAPAEMKNDYVTKAQILAAELAEKCGVVPRIVDVMTEAKELVDNVSVYGHNGVLHVTVLGNDIEASKQVSAFIAGALDKELAARMSTEENILVSAGTIKTARIANTPDRTITPTLLWMLAIGVVAALLLHVIPENDLFGTEQRIRSVSYAKWGYVFLLPFFLTFAIFTIVPLYRTFFESMFEHYWGNSGLKEMGPFFIGLESFVTIFAKENLAKYLGNTMIMWIMGFIPQIIVSLALAVWFTDRNMRIRFQPFFKTVIYMPNLIMASAFAMLFFVLFSDGGPINVALQSLGMEAVEWTRNVWGNRILVALMNFMMWFGNTTIVLMAAVMGIDQSLFEAADIDGANGWQSFTRVTMPLIRPVLSYTLITSLIGGLQMYDVPQVLTNGGNVANRSCMTIIMLLNNYIGKSKNYGYGGALSVLLFIVTAVLGLFVYWSLNTNEREAKKLAKEQKRKMEQMRKGGELA